MTWGMGGLGSLSHRILFSRLGDDFQINPPSDVMEATLRWTDVFWKEYGAFMGTPDAAQLLARCRALDTKSRYSGSATPNPSMRTEQEEKEYQAIVGIFFAGFCIAGRSQTGRGRKQHVLSSTPLFQTSPHGLTDELFRLLGCT